MRKYLLIVLIVIGLTAGIYIALNARRAVCSLMPRQKPARGPAADNADFARGLKLLKARKDAQALKVFNAELSARPDDINALWGKAEVLRRRYSLKEAENIVTGILRRDPNHLPSLNNLAYIRYKQNRIPEALELTDKILNNPSQNKENQAYAYLTLSAINGLRSLQGLIINKLQYGTRIRGNLEKARDLCPELAEVHLGLGTFYLKAPAIAGGNVNKAIDEIEIALKIAPDYALANARMAEAYLRKGDPAKYDLYMEKANELDPDKNFLKDLQG